MSLPNIRLLFRSPLMLAGASLLAFALLSGCRADSQPPAPESSAPVLASESSPAEAPTAVKDQAPAFDGVIGQEWYEVPIPLFDDMNGAVDLAYGAGKLWAVGFQVGAADSTFATPALATSSDGLEWTEIDLQSLGIPDNLSGNARLLATEHEVIVLFENQEGSEVYGDVPQRLPWVLRGDGSKWHVTGPEQFGQWQVNSRDSGKYLSYGELRAMAERNGEIILMPGIGWFEPYKTSDYSLGLGKVNVDNTAELIADFNSLQSAYISERVFRMFVYNGELLTFANSYTSRKEGGEQFFNIWRSGDGKEWRNETPQLPDRKHYTFINDVIIGPGGLAGVGWEAAQAPGSEYPDVSKPIALFSADGRSWTKTSFGEDKMENFHIAATPSAYYAYDKSAVVWRSPDGKTWNELAPITLQTSLDGENWTSRSTDNIFFSKVIGMSEGLIALGGSPITKGISIMFSGSPLK